MSGDQSHPTDCSEVLDHLYEYLDREMPDGDCAKFREHIEECSPCLEKYGLEQSVKKLVKRCCGQDEVPSDLRAKVLDRIDLIRCEEARQAEVAGRTGDSVDSGAIGEPREVGGMSRTRETSAARSEQAAE